MNKILPFFLFCTTLLIPSAGSAETQTVSFDQVAKYSSTNVILNRMLSARSYLNALTLANRNHRSLDTYPISPNEEKWLVYLPENSRDENPGLLVWLSNEPAPNLSASEKKELDAANMIYVSPYDSGTGTNLYSRRAPMVLNAINGMISNHQINPRKIYIGARGRSTEDALAISLAFPDIFQTTILSGTTVAIAKGNINPPSSNLLNIAQKNTYILTGSITAEQTESFSRYCLLNTRTSNNTSLSLRELIEHPKTQETAGLADCNKKLQENIAASTENIDNAIDEENLEEAISLWVSGYQKYGRLDEANYDKLAETLKSSIEKLDPKLSMTLKERFYKEGAQYGTTSVFEADIISD